MKLERTTVPFGFAGATAGAAICQIIRSSEPLSRAEIGRLTGLSKSTVSLHVERLLKLGLVIETTTSSGKRRRLEFNHQAGCVIAIDLGATSVDVALCDLDANIKDHQSQELLVTDGPEKVMASIMATIDSILASNSVRSDQLYGIGMGIPGPVEFSTGFPISPPIMPGWHKYPLREILSKRYRCVVYIDNDVNLMAVGEMKYGAGVGVPNQLFVKVGSGIGAGIILAGTLYRGEDGSAGDIGHISLKGREELCPCGNKGCLETIASGRALAKLGTKLANDGECYPLKTILEGGGEITAKDIADLADKGELLCLSLIRMSGEAIGEVLAGLINFINPSLIVMGGGLAGFGGRWITTIKEVVYRKSTPLATKQLDIRFSQLKNKAGVVGAAALVVDEVFSMNRVTEMVNQEG
ncbi:MAG: ROK family transcriptional regulator [Firmicutes bacterium]|nr:ROK family transcriptional regulator [Bacillota bacterium]